MKDVIDPIFNEWLEEHGEPDKTEKFINGFRSEVVKWNAIDVITEERKASFEAGFKTAVRLLVG